MFKQWTKLVVASLLLGFCTAAVVNMIFPRPTEADWRADQIREYVGITAAPETTDQHTVQLFKPTNAKGIYTYLDVTAGATLLLDVDLYAYNPATTDYILWFANIPSAGGITGVSANRAVWGPGNTGNDYAASMEDSAGLIPTRFRLTVDHGNANDATYVLYYQWVY